MNTTVFDAYDNTAVSACADIIRSGGLVAFPTETVYGLGANGLNHEAVKRIFVAKGRPCDNPLILHIADINAVSELFREIPPLFYTLSTAFFPGALTLIYYKSHIIPNEVSAGLETVAVRMPDNRCAHALIRACGVPIAAPSANTSGKPSPTCAKHVADDLNGKIDAILDGGACKIGLESTVLSITGKPTILRPGGITKEMLEEVLGKGEVDVSEAVLKPYSGVAPSPGMKYKHYAPQHAKAIAITGSPSEIAIKTCTAYDRITADGKTCVILAGADTASDYGLRNTLIIGLRSEPEKFCATLFGALRECDRYDYVLCETLPTSGLGLAYMNRLLRACAFETI